MHKLEFTDLILKHDMKKGFSQGFRQAKPHLFLPPPPPPQSCIHRTQHILLVYVINLFIYRMAIEVEICANP